MTSLSKNNTALAEAISMLPTSRQTGSRDTIGQWRKWDQWCSRHNIDPYHATPDGMDAYRADHPNISKIT